MKKSVTLENPSEDFGEGDPRPLVVIVTGLSGSGLSTAINTLQDNGFYCVDNLPVELLWDAITLVVSNVIQARGFVFGMDIRDQRFAFDFPKMKESLAEKVRLDVLFLEAATDTILRRFSSTRRRHPLLSGENDLATAIQKEARLLAPVRTAADGIIDTTLLPPTGLARFIELRYAENGIPLRMLFVTIVSFGFKYGPLSPAESIHDVRFLPNPYFDPKLKHRTGLDGDVQKFVMKDPLAQETFNRLDDLYRFLLPQYYREGKHFFRIGIGCTGGQHRSVTFAEGLVASLQSRPLPHIAVSVLHRDIEH